ncbi:antibiotic biosynthesis monooxygenase [Lentzea tibetensis]|uniref:Antibiotic biosynthesis monooxygenase n=1 Tax=Lentzea tibetensis TaxID=2591470 RepID=A0A563ES82_9PSEU|nr:antibiotic biosynthesis monooxygenase family protein [Lentzea tibetensis]TWP50519.1 antibiotic biosynthesis monooxygenase [Lentzea tibetensis]
MAYLSVDDGYLNILNWFGTDTPYKHERIVEAMRDIVDNAHEFPGWVSSSVHSGQDVPGTANLIQMRSRDAIEARYKREKMVNVTMPAFYQWTTSFKSIKAEVVFTQTHPDLGGIVEISAERDDFTVLTLFAADPENQAQLVEALAQPDEWLKTVPGFRSHSILRGIDGTHVAMYAQWDSKESYDAFHVLPESERPAEVRERRALGQALVNSHEPHTYTVVHSRSAAR